VTSPVPLASGRDADVFAIGTARVLRRYRDGGDVAAEAAVMAYVGGLGYPVPAVYAAAGPDLVMERLYGPTMVDALVEGSASIETSAQVLADLHVQLHALPARLSRDPAVRILHLDLHPGNVMITPRGPVVIDWRNATEGPAALDVAVSALILAEVAVDESDDLADSARALLAAFLARTGGPPRDLLRQAVAIRAADPNQGTAETGRLGRAAALVR
jgi:aminoglycoside phosphotransferase (APT) family kinase protein